MSRNKDIAFLHSFTGASYKDCRARMKAVNWDLGKALLYPNCLDAISDLLDSLKPCLANMCEAMDNLCHSVGDSFYTVADDLREETKQ